eukprot:TRINITY_DN93956_c0_g1_i1.p1 TRINITY_DN93956_c0_g1~~TRINITY_DN93956_c0_g1_i1.p1  ORF type:complete len:401 (+),score=63.91 TRINITY_DN93956_c0_g1_i1:26-1228(+)
MTDLPLRHLAQALNATVVGPFSWLRKEPFGSTLSAVAARYANAGLTLFQSLGVSCRLRDFQVVGRCEHHLECFAPELVGTLAMAHTELQRTARGVVRHLCRKGASAVMAALVAAIDSQATLYTSITSECISFSASLPWALMQRRQCSEIYDLGMQCAHSFFQAGALYASALKDFSQLGESLRSDWTFVSTWGAYRIEILSGLLELVAWPKGRDAPLAMAEVGVFLANTSTALLRSFPGLRMLLVDPYHLHTQDHRKHHQQMEEFYASPKSTFVSATEATQPFRERATHLMQTGAEAAAWIRPESLDLVFIDGDHRLESVIADIEAWWPVIRPGGILSGHDFAITFPGVVEAAIRFAMETELRLFIAPEVWWIQKPGSDESPMQSHAAPWLQGEALGACYL